MHIKIAKEITIGNRTLKTYSFLRTWTIPIFFYGTKVNNNNGGLDKKSDYLSEKDYNSMFKFGYSSKVGKK